MQTCFFFHSHNSHPFIYFIWGGVCSQLCSLLPLYLPLQILAPSHCAVSRLASRQSPLLALSPCSFSLLPLQWLHQLQPQPAGTSCGFEEISHSVQLLVKAWHSNYDSSHLLWYGRDPAYIFVKLDRWSDLRKGLQCKEKSSRRLCWK